MTLLLDTHAMLWFFWDDPQLSADAKNANCGPLVFRLPVALYAFAREF